MVQNKLLSTIQAYSLGFLTGNPLPWKRFCLFCLFHASLSIVDCSIQLVSTKFPNRVIYRVPRGGERWHMQTRSSACPPSTVERDHAH